MLGSLALPWKIPVIQFYASDVPTPVNSTEAIGWGLVLAIYLDLRKASGTGSRSHASGAQLCRVKRQCFAFGGDHGVNLTG